MIHGSTAAETAAPPRVARWLAPHLALALVVVLLFGVMHSTAGRITVREGEGWDGYDYASMLEGGWIRGSVFSRLRPLVVWLNQPAYALTGSTIAAFDAMNFLYAGTLAFVLSLLMERYGASGATRVVAIVCVGLSNGFRLPVYYPVLIDLGACAFMTLAIWLILTGPRWSIAVACVASVLAREYAPVVIFFGVHRDLRHRARLQTIAATYAPAALVYLALRVVVAKISVTPGNTLAVFLANRGLWNDPMFAALFAYFLLTILGGVSLVTAAQTNRCWRLLREESEWISFALPIVVVSALVGIDIWRYLVTLAPAVLVFYAHCSREWSRTERVVWSVAAIALTIWTQDPFERMNLTRYFTDWFPYYAWTNAVPDGVFVKPLWPDWAWRFLVAAGSLFTLMVYAKSRQPAATVTRA